jgi:hypothetical protein
MTASAQTNGAQNYTGEVTAAQPRAVFELELRAGEPVTLTTASARTTFDTILTLTGPDGRTVAENDDTATALTSQIIYVPTRTGRHRAIVTGFGGATGAFELIVSNEVEFGLSHAARVIRQERVTLTRQRREQSFTVDLAEDEIFVGSTFALAANVDPTLALADSSGEIVAANDDRGDGTLNSQVIFQAPRAGRYQLTVGTYDNTGGEMIVSLAIDPEADAPFNFSAIEGTPLARHEGSLNAEQPSRDYPLRLTAGQTILVLADTTGGDLDPVIRLSDVNGDPVAANDDRGDGSLNSAFAYTAAATATYTLNIERYRRSETSGNYLLVITNVDRSVVDTIQALAEDAVSLSGPELTLETRDFRVHYTLEGVDATTTEYAQATADTLQEMFEVQVRRIGWAEPIRDPDGRYRAYVADALGSMGYTKGVQMVFDNPNTSGVRERAAVRTVFVVDNGFVGMNRTESPISLMRATATHEFNHVIQFGYDGEEPLNWLYEATASWTETTTVGSDQDATNYTETDFASPQRCWTTLESGFDYSQWTLLQSIADVHGDGIVVRMWENAVRYDGFEVMSRTLSGVGTDIPSALSRWRAQNYARDYDLAPVFPRAVREQAILSRQGEWSTKDGPEQLGAHYLGFGQNLRGTYTISLTGDDDLELLGLGVRNGEVQVFRLGRGGAFNVGAFENAALMVFNRAVPSEPGACSASGRYRINVSETTDAMAAPQTRFNARHFQALRREPSQRN